MRANCESLSVERDIAARLEALRRSLHEGRPTNIGFPGACDLDYREISPFFELLLNNVGDPWTDPAGGAHTKAFEREVLDWFADLYKAPSDDWWGYLTSGGTEGNLYALYLARSRFPNGLVYHSEAAHYSIPKCLDVLGLRSVKVRTTDRGEIDYADLAMLIRQQRHRPAIVIANVGTTMTEAVDDPAHITQILCGLDVQASHLHVDAALSGIPLALDSTAPALLQLGATMDSISISGHKFLGTPIPCGVVLTRRHVHRRLENPVDYTATVDTTISGSRGGQVALLLWYVIRRLGVEGLRARAGAARGLAEYAVRRLNEIGSNAWRHPHGFTVVFETPPAVVTDRWVLATSGGWSHIVCMPGVSRVQIDAFVADIVAAQSSSTPPPTAVPRQRSRQPAA
jgi:histidine decarboxylase